MKQYWYYCGFRSHFYFMHILEQFPDYIISKSGIIYSKLTKRILSKSIDKRGYVRANLNQNGKNKCVLVHRLIALCYVPNPENKPQVNHINGIKSDNRIENLEWCTNQENQDHAFRVGLRIKGKYHKVVRQPKKKVLLDVKTGIYYNSIREAAELLGYNKGTLKDYISGKIRNKTSLIAV